jgi:hypothetical protein
MKTSIMMEFFGMFFFSFSAIYQFEERANDSKPVRRHGKNEHKRQEHGKRRWHTSMTYFIRKRHIM